VRDVGSESAVLLWSNKSASFCNHRQLHENDVARRFFELYFHLNRSIPQIYVCYLEVSHAGDTPGGRGWCSHGGNYLGAGQSRVGLVVGNATECMFASMRLSVEYLFRPLTNYRDYFSVLLVKLSKNEFLFLTWTSTSQTLKKRMAGHLQDTRKLLKDGVRSSTLASHLAQMWQQNSNSVPSADMLRDELTYSILWQGGPFQLFKNVW
jgi:hypothetical protein